jgi:hypothetical protein
LSAPVALGLLLALATAFASVAGFLYKFRGANEAPAVDMRRPVHSTFVLFKSPVYTLGIVIALGGWFTHVGALALAPISLVQATVAGGLVLLTVVADRMFGISVSRREWIGVALCAAGLAILAATIGNTANSAHSSYSLGRLVIFLAVIGTAGMVLARSKRGNMLAISAGLLWAVSDTSIKADSDGLHHFTAWVLVGPLPWIIFLASMVGLLISARSLQLGEAVPVIALTSAAANLATIAAGPIVFAEPLGHGGVAFVLRIVAFALVVVGASLTPPPMAEPAVASAAS